MAAKEEIEHHRRTVDRMSRPGEALAQDSENITVSNPEWFYQDGGESMKPKPERRKLHERLKSDYRRKWPRAKQERRALILAGAPGAGKSTLLKELLGEQLEDYLVLDADEFKELLLRQAQADGSYEATIKPDEVKRRETAGEEFFPLELATLVHEESSQLSTQLRSECIADGLNIVVDKVLHSADGAKQLMAELDEAGYRVEIVEVRVPFEVSQQRITRRWEEAYEASLHGEDDLGARWVPYQFARKVFDAPGDKSKPEIIAEKLAFQSPAVLRYRAYRTADSDTADADDFGSLEVDMSRAGYGAELAATPQR
ncbi:zeta toxin family protein [Glutamicibacter soli]|uniref:zeta toxin family protein n=1 Tax=Micrococcaceae TaxID=1268 RepID=UPI000EB2DBAD|nr:zeta toxin family protein [Arthrobacter sp. AG1021]RKS18344.1 zeta toxin [Arthrobacter sp. AG1021]